MRRRSAGGTSRSPTGSPDARRLAPGLQRLALQGLGKPPLSPHLLDVIRHAAERGVRVGFNTNGVLLARGVARAFAAAGTGYVHVSLDGATAGTYDEQERGRDGCSLAKAEVCGASREAPLAVGWDD